MEENNSYKQEDELIRSRFDGAEMAPSAESWDDIEKRLNGNKKRPPFIYWLSGIALLFIVAGCIWYFKQNTDLERSIAAIDKNARKEIAPRVSDAIPAAPNSTAGPETSAINNVEPTAVTTTTETTMPKNTATESTEAAKTETKTNGNDNSTPIANSTSKKKQESATSNSAATPATINISPAEQHAISAALAKGNSDPKNKRTTDGALNPANPLVNANAKPEGATNANVTNPTTTTASNNSTAANSSSNMTVNAAPKKDPENAVVENKKQAPPSSETKTPEQNKTIVSDSISNTVAKVTATEQKSEKADTASIQKDSSKTIVAATSLAPKKDSLKPDANEQTLPMALSVYFSPDYFQNKVVDNSGQNAADEKQSLRYSAGFKFTYVLLDKLSVRLGVAYSEFKQQLDEHKIYFDRYITEPFVFHSSLGDMAVDADVMKEGFSEMAPPSITQFGFNYSYTQRVQSIHIPLEVKYGFNFKKIGISVIAGVNTQYAFKQHTELVLTKENVTNTLSYGDMGINKLTFAGLLGLSVDVNLNKRLSLFLEPNARMNFTPISKSTVVKSNPHFFGANAGLAIHF